MTPLETLDNLADRIENGQVVFFIGAGFSIDSEGNTAARLMRRLLVRFEAMTEVLSRRLRKTKPQNLKDEVERLPESLRNTFSLKLPEYKPESTPAEKRSAETKALQSNLRKLAEKYFEANDWFCASFQRLLQLACAAATKGNPPKADDANEVLLSPAGPKLRSFVNELSECENELLKEMAAGSDNVPLLPLDPRLFPWSLSNARDASRARTENAGKALFLETMGFSDEAIMGGRWRVAHHDVLAQYTGKLLPRFHVLGRLAREGLCPTVLTTNYDLLLEGAWRAVGFASRDTDQSQPVDDVLMPTVPLSDTAQVGEAREFFEFGDGRTANVMKVHGCVEHYRDAKRKGWNSTNAWLARELEFRDPSAISDTVNTDSEAISDTADEEELPVHVEHVALDKLSWEAWSSYLPSMVFTYREIQNWRDDSWARDFLATTQRTQTVVFAGYSLQDPVMHDSVRSVYEGMSRQRQRRENGNGESDKQQHNRAPAFFWSSIQDSSFYASEVLDAASAAQGQIRNERRLHPNTVKFGFRHEGIFPDLDDSFLLLFHRMFRKQQAQCVDTDLPHVVSALLGRLVIKSELAQLRRRLHELLDAEERVFRVINESVNEAEACSDDNGTDSETLNTKKTKLKRESARRQRQFRDTIHWTYSFGSNLLKELAAVEMLQRSSGPSTELALVRSPGWYLPARANRMATVWGLVVELAVRTLFAEAAADGSCPNPFDGKCQAANTFIPEVFGRLASPTFPKGTPDPVCLQIHAGAINDRARQHDVSASSCFTMIWELPISRAPWPVSGDLDMASLEDRWNGLWQNTSQEKLPPPPAEDIWHLALGTPNTISKWKGQLRQGVEQTARLGLAGDLVDTNSGAAHV